MSLDPDDAYDQGIIAGRAEMAEENARLRGLLREVLDDTPMYRIDRYTEAKIRAVLEPKK